MVWGLIIVGRVLPQVGYDAGGLVEPGFRPRRYARRELRQPVR